MADALTCRELVEIITEYLEGAMPPAERIRFEDHVKGCTGCTRYLAQMRVTIETLGEVGLENIQPEAKSELMSAFRNWKSSAHRYGDS
jgi:anti-sigma factor RsiW